MTGEPNKPVVSAFPLLAFFPALSGHAQEQNRVNGEKVRLGDVV
jgi:hypothetical protein